MRYRKIEVGEPERYARRTRRGVASIEKACRDWVGMGRRGISPGEQARMTRMMEKYVFPVAGKRSVGHVDDDFRGEIFARMKELHAPEESREIVIGILRGMAEDALRKGWIRYNPFLEHPMIRVGEGKKYPALTEEEIRLLMGMDPRKPENACLQVQLLTGMRPAEARGLCWKDIEEQDGQILIRHQLRDGQSVPVNRTKNYRKRRISPAGMTFDILREVRENQQGQHELVFVDSAGNGMNGRRLHQLLREIIGRDSVRLHDLRVTHATMLYRKTKDLHQVSRRLGHSGMEVTRRHYVHAEPDLSHARMVQDEHYGYLCRRQGEEKD